MQACLPTPVLQIPLELARNAIEREARDPLLVRLVDKLLKEAEQRRLHETAVSEFVSTGVAALYPQWSAAYLQQQLRPLMLYHFFTNRLQVYGF